MVKKLIYIRRKNKITRLLITTTLMCIILSLYFLSCATTYTFHNTSISEVENLVKQLEGITLEELFRYYPTLTLHKSTDLGKGKKRHEFRSLHIEEEDLSTKLFHPSSDRYTRSRKITYAINIFVDKDGVIYEVLDPVLTNLDIVPTSERISDYIKRTSKN